MLTHYNDRLLEISTADLEIYRRVLPRQSTLQDALDLIPWESFVPELEAYYSRDLGQPAIPPLIMLKLEFLRYYYRLSDRQVIEQAWTDLNFRWFLQIPITHSLPDPTSLTKFRGRLGAEGFKTIFDRLVNCARDKNLIRDRLRLKDATHVIANIAVPTTLGLLAQLRERMLGVIEKFDSEAMIGFRIETERIRLETQHAGDDVKLQQRLDQIVDILGWLQSQREPTPGQSEQSDALWNKLQAVRTLAEKIVQDYLHPGQGDRTLSVVDPDARRGKHGDFFDGYLVDVMMDADSQLITEVEVIPANGEEAKDTVHLVEMEHKTHGNQVEQVSIDGAGFHGETLRKLEDPDGLAVDVITPPRDFHGNGGFSATAFTLSSDETVVTCPAGQTSHRRSVKKDKRNTKTYTFRRDQCIGCPLLMQCFPAMTQTSRTGRRVTKNEYEAEYERVRQKATTPQYAAVRGEHPAIERKLNEIVRHHHGRKAKYWGQAKIRMQQIMTCFAVNVKRMCRLLREEVRPQFTG
jgi:transposase